MAPSSSPGRHPPGPGRTGRAVRRAFRRGRAEGESSDELHFVRLKSGRSSGFLPEWRRQRSGSPESIRTSAAAYYRRPMAASAQYSVTVRVELDARQEPLGKLTAQIAEAGGALQSVDL